MATAALAFASVANAYRPSAWGCFERQADGQCIVTVSIGNGFAEIDQRVIREVMANFSESPNIEVVEAASRGSADVAIVQGCAKGHLCGFFTDMQTRVVYIDKQWSYANYCCDAHDGMRGVYCHELMHGLGIDDFWTRSEPSCFNGTSPYLGVEDRLWISQTY